MDRILRIKEVERVTGYSRATIYRKMNEKELPSSIKLGGGRAIGWLQSEIERWLESRRQF
ncbi:MAG: transcriptional regulator [Gammaproteobacteria bacterium]|jgi:prophage regulatory protein|nr:transcriptional regulator [Gammaproteobacteria bacterium]